jgi:hypothetical protein
LSQIIKLLKPSQPARLFFGSASFSEPVSPSLPALEPLFTNHKTVLKQRSLVYNRMERPWFKFQGYESRTANPRDFGSDNGTFVAREALKVPDPSSGLSDPWRAAPIASEVLNND